MKIYTKIFVLTIVVIFSSCKDWLDVTPAGQATEEDLFSSGNGYRSVLNGLYKSMGSSELYGMELTFGMVDCMAQVYDLETDEAFANQKYKDATKFDYTSANLSGTIEGMWARAYNIIANANDLIQNAGTASNDVFAEGEMERKMILGEAYACRALIHFDLLRLFAPAPVNDDGGAYIPYVDAYPTLQTGKIGVMPCLEKVIADLKMARELTIGFDTTVVGQAVNFVGRGRFDNKFLMDDDKYIDEYIDGFQSKMVDDFFKGRGYRLSYYATTALLARVCQYAGRDKDAFDYAEEVMNFKVKLTDGRKLAMFKDDFSKVMITEGHTAESFEKRTDVKILSNLIFAAYDKLAYDREGSLIKAYWTVSNVPNWFQISQSYFSRGNVDESELDYRWRYMMYLGNSRYPVSGKWYVHENSQYRYNLSIFPVLRATEMHYIMAEYYARQGNVGKGYEILNSIRENRGIYGSSMSGSNWAEFQSDLLHEARREWLSEGQMFYLYKRLNASVKIGDQVRPMTRAEYLLPVPADVK